MKTCEVDGVVYDSYEVVGDKNCGGCAADGDFSLCLKLGPCSLRVPDPKSRTHSMIWMARKVVPAVTAAQYKPTHGGYPND